MMTLWLLAAGSLWEAFGESSGQEIVCLLYDACLRFCVHSTVSWLRRVHIYTGRFIMFSVITNIYNKKAKGPTLTELFAATRKLNFFWQLEMFDVCTTGDTAHIETIFKFLPHTRQHGCIDILHCCNDPWLLSHPGHVAMLLCVLCTKCTSHSNRRLTVWYSNTQNDFSPGAAIFSLHKLASPSGRNVNYDEKQLTGGKKKLWFVPSIYTGFVNTCPMVFL